MKFRRPVPIDDEKLAAFANDNSKSMVFFGTAATVKKGPTGYPTQLYAFSTEVAELTASGATALQIGAATLAAALFAFY